MSSQLTSQDSTKDQSTEELQPGTTLLHGQYEIEQFLNNGGFGITYLAKDSLHRRVVIKECFPESLVRRGNSTVRVRSRDQLEAFRTIVELFIEEARNLARLSHPNIVGVHQVFEDNDTAYMAMDFVQGRDLLDITETGSSFKPSALEKIVVKLLDAIEFMHTEGILHRDIAPDNILLSNDNEPVLIDFGAARETVTRETSYLGSMRTVKDGYSPQEFYVNNSEQHPSSDLYSLAASIYHVMAKELPISAQIRMTAIASGDPDPYVSIREHVTGFSDPFLDTIDHALQVFPKDRIQTAAEWRAQITQTRVSQITRGSVSRPTLAVDNGPLHPREEGSAVPKRPPVPTPSRLSPRPSRPPQDFTDEVTLVKPAPSSSGKGLYIGVAVAAILALVGGGAVIMNGNKATDSDVQVASPAATTEAPVFSGSGESSTPPATETQTANSGATASEPRKPEQVPFFLADSSEGDVSVSSANGRLASGGTLRSSDTSAPSNDVSEQIAGDATESPAATGFDGTATTDIVQAAQPTDITIDTGSVISGKAIRLPIIPDPADPTIVLAVEGPAADQLEAGYRVVSVNGFPMTTLADFQRVVDATADYAVGDEVSVAFGIEDPATGATFVRNIDLPAVQSTSLLNGVRFETSQGADGWATIVAEANGTGDSDLQVGDQVVALMPTNELLDQQDSMSRLLERELASGTTQFNFAVKRDGDMWVVSMPYSGI